MNSTIQEIKKLLSHPRKIVITTHNNPDGDALGSSLGLFHYLVQKGHQVLVITPNDFPSFLKWMPGTKKTAVYEYHTSRAANTVKEAELIFCLDFNDLARLEKFHETIAQSGAIKILIDHHPQPSDFAQHYIHREDASSTAELIYDLIQGLGDDKYISRDVATCLYVGILTDTGSYQFSSTTAKVHRIAAELIDKGVPDHIVYDKIYNNSSELRVRFFGFCATERMNIYPESQAALIYVSKEDQNRFNLKKGDTEGLVNLPLQIKGVRFATLIIDKDDMVKMSFRSKGDFDVNKFARKHFKGGGHRNASGGSSDLTLEQTVQKFETLLPESNKITNQSI